MSKNHYESKRTDPENVRANARRNLTALLGQINEPLNAADSWEVDYDKDDPTKRVLTLTINLPQPLVPEEPDEVKAAREQFPGIDEMSRDELIAALGQKVIAEVQASELAIEEQANAQPTD